LDLHKEPLEAIKLYMLTTNWKQYGNQNLMQSHFHYAKVQLDTTGAVDW
jgi:hypothetical protein